jgi:hypothetical protein
MEAQTRPRIVAILIALFFACAAFPSVAAEASGKS